MASSASCAMPLRVHRLIWHASILVMLFGWLLESAAAQALDTNVTNQTVDVPTTPGILQRNESADERGNTSSTELTQQQQTDADSSYGGLEQHNGSREEYRKEDQEREPDSQRRDRMGSREECQDRELIRSPCADGSRPKCEDGSEPDVSVQPPSCPSGTPLCLDGSEPAKPSQRQLRKRKGGSCGGSGGSDNKTLKIVLMASGVGSFVLAVAGCICWRLRISRSKLAHESSHQHKEAHLGTPHQKEAVSATVVYGTPIDDGHAGKMAQELHKISTP